MYQYEIDKQKYLNDLKTIKGKTFKRTTDKGTKETMHSLFGIENASRNEIAQYFLNRVFTGQYDRLYLTDHFKLYSDFYYETNIYPLKPIVVRFIYALCRFNRYLKNKEDIETLYSKETFNGKTYRLLSEESCLAIKQLFEEETLVPKEKGEDTSDIGLTIPLDDFLIFRQNITSMFNDFREAINKSDKEVNPNNLTNLICTVNYWYYECTVEGCAYSSTFEDKEIWLPIKECLK